MYAPFLVETREQNRHGSGHGSDGSTPVPGGCHFVQIDARCSGDFVARDIRCDSRRLQGSNVDEKNPVSSLADGVRQKNVFFALGVECSQDGDRFLHIR